MGRFYVAAILAAIFLNCLPCVYNIRKSAELRAEKKRFSGTEVHGVELLKSNRNFPTLVSSQQRETDPKSFFPRKNLSSFKIKDFSP